MADLVRMPVGQATVSWEPGRVVVTHADGTRDVYTIALARHWAELLRFGAANAELLQAAADHDGNVIRLSDGKAGAR